MAAPTSRPVDWTVSPGLTPYSDAVAAMEAAVARIAAGESPEQVWLLEHPPLYTAGTSEIGRASCRERVLQVV